MAMTLKEQCCNKVLQDTPNGPAPTGSGRAEAIIKAASHCFAKWGVSRTRLNDVAKEVGIARPHLYRYFASKDAIIHAVILKEIRDNHARLRAQFPLQGPAEAILLGSLMSNITEAAKNADTAILIRADSAHITARMLASSPEIVAEVKKYWAPLLEYARERSELSNGVDIDAATRWLAFLEFSYMALPELLPADESNLKQQLRAFVLPAIFNA